MPPASKICTPHVVVRYGPSETGQQRRGDHLPSSHAVACQCSGSAVEGCRPGGAASFVGQPREYDAIVPLSDVRDPRGDSGCVFQPFADRNLVVGEFRSGREEPFTASQRVTYEEVDIRVVQRLQSCGLTNRLFSVPQRAGSGRLGCDIRHGGLSGKDALPVADHLPGQGVSRQVGEEVFVADVYRPFERFLR